MESLAGRPTRELGNDSEQGSRCFSRAELNHAHPQSPIHMGTSDISSGNIFGGIL